MTENKDRGRTFYIIDSHGGLCFYGPDKSTITQDFANHVGIEWDILEKRGYTVRTELPPLSGRSKSSKE